MVVNTTIHKYIVLYNKKYKIKYIKVGHVFFNTVYSRQLEVRGKKKFDLLQISSYQKMYYLIKYTNEYLHIIFK